MIINNDIEIARIRERILAFFIDLFTFIIIGYIIAYFYGGLNDTGGYHLEGTNAFILFLFGFYIWPISEGIFGQTLGKRILNLKVVTLDNRPIGFGKAFARFFLGFIDYIFLVGIIVAYKNDRKQRIGDNVAGTIVIKNK